MLRNEGVNLAGIRTNVLREEERRSYGDRFNSYAGYKPVKAIMTVEVLSIESGGLNQAFGIP